ncbi:MAG TPA: RDD family protein [Candidatus Acidoferrum sp.]|nr:RDD family protein [Candidatus Acidoferrum sp.]
MSIPATVASDAPPAYAGFWPRLAATVIDACLLFTLFLPLALVGVVSARLTNPVGHDPGAVILIVVLLVALVVPFLYFGLMESSPWQATFGKKALGLRVTDAQGRRLSLARATARNLAKLLSTATVGVGYMICGFTHRKQALHDMAASCLVVRGGSPRSRKPGS